MERKTIDRQAESVLREVQRFSTWAKCGPKEFTLLVAIHSLHRYHPLSPIFFATLHRLEQQGLDREGSQLLVQALQHVSSKAIVEQIEVSIDQLAGYWINLNLVAIQHAVGKPAAVCGLVSLRALESHPILLGGKSVDYAS